MQLELDDFENKTTRLSVKEVDGEEGVYQQHINGTPTSTFFRKNKDKKNRWEWCCRTQHSRQERWATIGKAKLIHSQKKS